LFILFNTASKGENIPELSMVQQGILFQNVIQAVKNRIVDDQKNNKRNYSYKQNNFCCQGWHFGVFTGKSVTVTGLFFFLIRMLLYKCMMLKKGRGRQLTNLRAVSTYYAIHYLASIID